MNDKKTGKGASAHNSSAANCYVPSDFAEQLVKAVHRNSNLIADNLGLPLKPGDLKYIFRTIGKLYIIEKTTDEYVPTMKDLLTY